MNTDFATRCGPDRAKKSQEELPWTMLSARAVTKAKARLLWLAFNETAQLSCIRQSASTVTRSRSRESSEPLPAFSLLQNQPDLRICKD